MTGVAVNVTLLPEHAAPEVLAVMLTLNGTFGLTVMLTVLDTAGLPVAQAALDVTIQVIASPLFSVDEV